MNVPWSYKALCSAFRGDAIKDELAPWRSEVVTGSYQARLEALGNALANSKPLNQALRTLRRLQRRLDRQRRANNPCNYLSDRRIKPGVKSWARSERMLRTEQRIARLHERVANLRREQSHKLTSALTGEFGVIGIETLQVRNLMANRRLALQIAEGIKSYMARTGRFTPNARGGQVSLVQLDERSPMKREESADSAQRREALAVAA